MSDDLVKQAREALNGVSKEPWEIEWYICQADVKDVQHAKTRKLKRGETRRDLKVGDELWRVPTRIGPISSEHNHWSGTSLACNVADAMFVKEAHSLLPLMADRIEELEERLKAATDDAKEAEAYAGEMEAKLEQAEVIIRIIASDKWDERHGEAVDLSCEYLAELKGEK
jgi:hypothetical protein